MPPVNRGFCRFLVFPFFLCRFLPVFRFFQPVRAGSGFSRLSASRFGLRDGSLRKIVLAETAHLCCSRPAVRYRFLRFEPKSRRAPPPKYGRHGRQIVATVWIGPRFICAVAGLRRPDQFRFVGRSGFCRFLAFRFGSGSVRAGFWLFRHGSIASFKTGLAKPPLTAVGGTLFLHGRWKEINKERAAQRA